MVDSGSGGFCRLTVLLFEPYGAEHVQGRVPLTAVVDPFDPVGDTDPRRKPW